jgi:hypothetical protein
VYTPDTQPVITCWRSVAGLMVRRVVEVVELADGRPGSHLWRCGGCGSADCDAQRYVCVEADDPSRWKYIFTAHALAVLP